VAEDRSQSPYPATGRNHGGAEGRTTGDAAPQIAAGISERALKKNGRNVE
jgi:hypothetical protein